MDQDIPAKQFMQQHLSFHEQVIDKIVDFADIWRLVLPPRALSDSLIRTAQETDKSVLPNSLKMSSWKLADDARRSPSGSAAARFIKCLLARCCLDPLPMSCSLLLVYYHLSSAVLAVICSLSSRRRSATARAKIVYASSL